MADIELALAASARNWSDRLHSFLSDHGGARVRTVVMGPDDVLAESYGVLVIDDVCSFLTPRLITEVHRRSRLVLGVFDSADGADAKRRLLECGIHNMVEADASPEEFLAAIATMQRVGPGNVVSPPVLDDRRSGRVVAVGAPPGGCGASEIAVALAAESRAVLIDADDVAPSLAQRLGVPLHPNLRTAIDIVQHGRGSLGDVVMNADGVRLVAGLVTGEEWDQIHPGEVEAVVEDFARLTSTVVVNISSGLERPQRGEGRYGLARGVVAMADALVGVGVATPTGVTRLIRWWQEALLLNPTASRLAVVNRMPRSGYRRSEVATEIAHALDGVDLVFVRDDPRVAEAAWAGSQVARGPFRRALRRLGGLVQ